jgi:hypothetical protein
MTAVAQAFIGAYGRICTAHSPAVLALEIFSCCLNIKTYIRNNNVQYISDYNQRVSAGKRNVKSYKILWQSLCPLPALDLLASFDSVNLVTSELKHYLTQVSRSLGIKKVCIV